MSIFRAIGLGLVIIILRFLMPVVFDSMEHTLLQVFHTLDGVMAKSQVIVQTAAITPNADHLIPR